MNKYGGSVSNITPTVGSANFVLESIANKSGFIEDFNGGGLATTTTAMQVRLARDSAVGTGSRTAGNVQCIDKQASSADNAMFFSTAYATTAPTIIAGALLIVPFNAHGGVWRWLAAPGEEFYLSGAASIEARQDIGTAACSMGIVWTER